MSKNDYNVGYKKPPKASQFKPGQSGNPKGRPKGTRNLATDLQEELSAKIVVREGNKQQRMSKQQALVKTLFNNALKGDIRAINTFLRLIERTKFDDEDLFEATDVGIDDQKIIEAFIARRLADESSKE